MSQLQNMNPVQLAFEVMKFFVPFLFALCFHEFAHGWVARMKGDRTAETMGRLTLNPFAHADILGTVVLPIMAIITHIPLFGWAKPVPVDERNLKNPRVDMFWISAAGPAANLFLALVGAIATGLFVRFYAGALMAEQAGPMQIMDVLKMFIGINVYLAVFNLIPLYPLDGAKVLARFLPHNVNRWLEDMQSYTSILLLLLFMSGAMVIIAIPASYVRDLFFTLAQGVAVV